MATCNFFNQFKEELCSGTHDFSTGTTHVIKCLLTLTAPVATNSVKGDLTEISSGNGYSAGGTSVGTITGAQTSGTMKVSGGTDPVFTASGGTIGAFRYAVLYNDTPTSPADPLMCWYDYGSSITLAAGETFTVDLDQSNGIFTLA